MNVPFVDLKIQYRNLKQEMDSAIFGCLENTSFIGGPDHKAFEKEFGEFLGGAHVAAVGNGTDAIELALRALEVGSGDEVIAPSHTFIATAEAITATGARPVFVDILPETYCLDPAAVEAAITPRTKAVIPVHLYGNPADMDALGALAKDRGLFVVEDTAQAHGATWDGRAAGILGDLGSFSFYPGKNLGAYGDGGAVVGTDADLVGRVRMICNHGRKEKYTHEFEGVNSRLDGLQAAVLRVKLRHLADWNQGRREAAEGYIERLSDVSGLTLPLPPDHGKARQVYHLFVVRCQDRDGLAAHLKSKGVSCGIHYPIPLHLQPAYAYLGMGEGALPHTEQAAREILSLPIFPEITGEQLDAVASAVREFFGA